MGNTSKRVGCPRCASFDERATRCFLCDGRHTVTEVLAVGYQLLASSDPNYFTGGSCCPTIYQLRVDLDDLPARVTYDAFRNTWGSGEF